MTDRNSSDQMLNQPNRHTGQEPEQPSDPQVGASASNQQPTTSLGVSSEASTGTSSANMTNSYTATAGAPDTRSAANLLSTTREATANVVNASQSQGEVCIRIEIKDVF
jgi:hypothetical protein